MSDQDDFLIDKFGEPLEEPSEGTLLYDPSTPFPIDGDLDEGEETEPRRPWMAWAAAGLVAVGALGVFGYQLTRPAESAEGPVELPPMVAPLPDAGTDVEMIVPVPSDTPEGTVGSNLRIGVRVSRAAGMAWADTVVEFTVESGEAVLSESRVRTTVDGIATTSLALPLHPSETIVTAQVLGSAVEAGRIFATARPGTPTGIQAVAGGGQEAEVGQLLPTRVVVAVTDAEGNPVPGTVIRFRIDTGEGLTAPSQTRTDAQGRASALWRLGIQDGPQRLVASSPFLEGEVAFTATGTPRQTVDRSGPNPVETQPVTVVRSAFAIGGSHTCGLAGGSLSCRGGNDRGQTSVSGPLGFLAIAAGASHTCALSADGVASCWGANEAGQLGDGTTRDRSSAVRVRTELKFSTLAAGSAHTCGIAGGGVPLCWGQNLSGQLGDGTRNDQAQPRIVGGGLSFRTIAAGWTHTCGLSANGNAFCWGLNSSGQLGDGSRLDRLEPTLVRGAVEDIVAGSAHTCGISEGQVLCWGGNSFGQLGDGTAADNAQPVSVQGIEGRPVELASGAVHTCARTSSGLAFCWGQNFQGQLGDGTTENRARAVPVAGGLTFAELHAGGAQTCGRTATGEQYCWGLNQSGQLGDGTRMSRSTPTLVGG
jgi:hypothetical protein